MATMPAMFAQGLEGYADDRLADGPGWVTFDVASIVCPVIVLHGGSDVIVDVVNARHTAAIVPNAELRIYDELGHFSIEREIVSAVSDDRTSSSSELTRRAISRVGLNRRVFVAVGLASAIGATFVGARPAAADAETIVYRLNADWGCPVGPKGRRAARAEPASGEPRTPCSDSRSSAAPWPRPVGALIAFRNRQSGISPRPAPSTTKENHHEHRTH